MRFPRSAKIFRGQVDVAPYIGVLFLMVIFLTFKSHIIHPPGIRITLPKVEGAFPVTGNFLVLSIDPNGLLYFEDQMVSEAELKTRLTQQTQNLESEMALLIYADENVSYGRITAISALAAEAGIADIRSATGY